MAVTITFSSPVTDIATWNQIYVKRATTLAGSYSTIATIPARNPDGSWVTSYFDKNGDSTKFYKVQPYDSVNAVTGADSDPIYPSAAVYYLTLKEARLLTKLQPLEYDDETMELLLAQATEDVDQKTGRTWKGEQTVTTEYYDGNGTNYLQLKHVDITNVTALAISEENDGNFTTVTVSKVTWYENGSIILDSNMHADLEATAFTKGSKTVRVSYTHGNDEPDSSVKQLCKLLLISNVKGDTALDDKIKKKISELKNAGLHFV